MHAENFTETESSYGQSWDRISNIIEINKQTNNVLSRKISELTDKTYFFLRLQCNNK